MLIRVQINIQPLHVLSKNQSNKTRNAYSLYSCINYRTILLSSNMTEKENLPMLNITRQVPNRSKKSLVKINKEFPSVKSIKDKPLKTLASYDPHPAEKYFFGTVPNTNQFKKFTTLLYQGLLYAVCSLKGPSEDYLRKKSLRLPEPKQSKKKFLMLDLDQTLIHSVWGDETSEITLKKGEETVRLNIRPYCFSFLQKMSHFFEVFVFTASTQDYAQTIVAHLNQKKKTIQGLLCRQNCLQTHNGLRIKDLRIIKNRGLSDIIIVDNLVHSFGLQLDNGIPILDFTNNKQDKELFGLEKLLIEMKDVPDVRQFLRNRLALKKCLEINEDEFLNVGGRKIGKKA